MKDSIVFYNELLVTINESIDGVSIYMNADTENEVINLIGVTGSNKDSSKIVDMIETLVENTDVKVWQYNFSLMKVSSFEFL